MDILQSYAPTVKDSRVRNLFKHDVTRAALRHFPAADRDENWLYGVLFGRGHSLRHFIDAIAACDYLDYPEL